MTRPRSLQTADAGNALARGQVDYLQRAVGISGNKQALRPGVERQVSQVPVNLGQRIDRRRSGGAAEDSASISSVARGRRR